MIKTCEKCGFISEQPLIKTFSKEGVEFLCNICNWEAQYSVLVRENALLISAVKYLQMAISLLSQKEQQQASWTEGLAEGVESQQKRIVDQDDRTFQGLWMEFIEPKAVKKHEADKCGGKAKIRPTDKSSDKSLPAKGERSRSYKRVKKTI